MLVLRDIITGMATEEPVGLDRTLDWLGVEKSLRSSWKSDVAGAGHEFVMCRFGLPDLSLRAPFSKMSVSAISRISKESMTSRSWVPISRLVARGNLPVFTGTDRTWASGRGGGGPGGRLSGWSGIHFQTPPLTRTVCAGAGDAMPSGANDGTLFGRVSRPEPGIAGGKTPDEFLVRALLSCPARLPFPRKDVDESYDRNVSPSTSSRPTGMARDPPGMARDPPVSPSGSLGSFRTSPRPSENALSSFASRKSFASGSWRSEGWARGSEVELCMCDVRRKRTSQLFSGWSIDNISASNSSSSARYEEVGLYPPFMARFLMFEFSATFSLASLSGHRVRSTCVFSDGNCLLHQNVPSTTGVARVKTRRQVPTHTDNPACEVSKMLTGSASTDGLAFCFFQDNGLWW